MAENFKNKFIDTIIHGPLHVEKTLSIGTGLIAQQGEDYSHIPALVIGQYNESFANSGGGFLCIGNGSSDRSRSNILLITDDYIKGTRSALMNINGTFQYQTASTQSDANLKTDIQPYKPKKSILDLPLYKFNFKGCDDKEIGCLAQDLQEIAPELVHKESNGYLSIDETKLAYLLLLELKQLREEFETLIKEDKGI